MGLNAVANYSPWLVLIVGLATYLGFLGTGLLTLGALRVHLPSPWKQAVAVAAGLGIISLLVQLVGMAHLATRPVLIAIWSLSVLCGLASLPWSGPLTPADAPDPDEPRWLRLLTRAVLLAALAILLVISLAPSTKIDELVYHMLVPARLVSDGALHFYREPWEGAILPHMAYPLALAPLHAMNLRDASNVASVCTALTLAWFGWYLVAESTRRRAFANIAAVVMLVGIHAITNYTAAGSHAPTDLISCALVLAIFRLDFLRDRVGPAATALAIGILAAESASMKVSLGPVVVLCLLLAAWLLLTPREGVRPKPLPVLAGLILPGVVLCLPILAWTFHTSGSPLGPMLAGKFGPTVYDHAIIQKTLAETFAINAISPVDFAKGLVTYYTPLFWLGVLLAVIHPALSPRTRAIAAFLFLFQGVLVWFFLTRGARFMGGIPYAMYIAAAMAITAGLLRRLAAPAGVLALVILGVLPWLGIGVLYSRQFLPVFRGHAATESFLHNKVALLDDWRALDRLLPPDAVILIVDALRESLVYSPRLVVEAPADVPPGRPTYLMKFKHPTDKPPIYPLTGWRIGETVYDNPEAVITTYRTPGRLPEHSHVWVQRLQPEQ